MDESNINAGKDWRKAIDTALHQSLAVIIVITSGAVQSHNVTYEWATAKALGKEIIPLRFSDLDEGYHPIFDLQHRMFINPSKIEWLELLSELETIIEAKHIPFTVEEAERILYSPRPNDWPNAINTLRDFEHASATEALVRHVHNLSPEVSKLAGIALAQRTHNQDARAIPGLAKATTDRTTNALMLRAQQAIDALGFIGGSEATTELLSLLENLQEHEENLQIQIVQALGRAKHEKAIPKLINLFDGERYELRRTAILALGELTHPLATSYLVELIKHPTWNQAAFYAAQALGRIKDTSTIPFLTEQLHELVAVTPDDASRHGDQRMHDGQAMARALGDIGGGKALEALKEALKKVREPNIRNAIKNAIQQIEDNP
jgi:HEAT repeat protein